MTAPGWEAWRLPLHVLSRHGTVPRLHPAPACWPRFEGPACEVDINECVRGTSGCAPTAVCLNSEASPGRLLGVWVVWCDHHDVEAARCAASSGPAFEECHDVRREASVASAQWAPPATRVPAARMTLRRSGVMASRQRARWVSCLTWRAAWRRVFDAPCCAPAVDAAPLWPLSMASRRARPATRAAMCPTHVTQPAGPTTRLAPLTATRTLQ